MTISDQEDLSFLLKSPVTLKYDRKGKQTQPAQKAMRECRKILLKLLPPGFIVRNSGSQQNLPEIVWISILNPEITKSTQSGFYIVFLYDVNLNYLYLSLNQGFTEHKKNAISMGLKGKAQIMKANETLRHGAKVILNYIDPQIENNYPGLIKKINLISEKELAQGYEAGHIIGFKYKISELPTTDQIQFDLGIMQDLYGIAIQALSEINTSSVEQRLITSIEKVKPKSNNKYRIDSKFEGKEIATHFRTMRTDKIEVTPLHENLIKEFVLVAEKFHWKAINKNIHPRDLILIKDQNTEVLVEAKVVSTRDALVVREAFAQLFEYKYKYHFEQNIPLVALFNREISDENMKMLDYYGIKSIYLNSGKWEGNAKELLGFN
jgi:hypothetical protein